MKERYIKITLAASIRILRFPSVNDIVREHEVMTLGTTSYFEADLFVSTIFAFLNALEF